MRLLLVLSLLAACAGAPPRPSPPPPPSAIFGLWALTDGSTAVMRIDRAGPREVAIEAWTTDGKVHFEVTAIAWDGRRLHATFRYPPTGTLTTSDLILINADRLEGTVSGAYQARETWLRSEDSS